ncbi:MAG: phosphotransferase family protein [Pyrinomonadaceae bacterium]
MESKSDTKPVRRSEQLDWGRLEEYLRERLASSSEIDAAAPLEVEQFHGGHSNLTYLLRFGESEFVLRRPPFGPVPPRAHDMAREFRILSAVHPVFQLAPRPVLLCEDTSVIGSIFYLMERRRGIVVRHVEPSLIADQPAARRLASEAMLDTLARLHTVDINAHGLDSLGKPAGFVERQVKGWSERWQRSQTTELKEMDDVAAWLVQNLPPDPARPAMVHGDYKLDNVMFDASDISRVVAVFDWEMSAVGDPLIDLGLMLCYWLHANSSSNRDDLSSVTDRPGWFTREEILERYAARTRLDLSRIAFYEVFALFKVAVVIQQIFYRYKRGQTDDPRFAHLNERVDELAKRAAVLIEQT